MMFNWIPSPSTWNPFFSTVQPSAAVLRFDCLHGNWRIIENSFRSPRYLIWILVLNESEITWEYASIEDLTIPISHPYFTTLIARHQFTYFIRQPLLWFMRRVRVRRRRRYRCRFLNAFLEHVHLLCRGTTVARSSVWLVKRKILRTRKITIYSSPRLQKFISKLQYFTTIA